MNSLDDSFEFNQSRNLNLQLKSRELIRNDTMKSLNKLEHNIVKNQVINSKIL